jgi:hypothetical protein
MSTFWGCIVMHISIVLGNSRLRQNSQKIREFLPTPGREISKMGEGYLPFCRLQARQPAMDQKHKLIKKYEC